MSPRHAKPNQTARVMCSVLALVVLACGGCIERTVTITSEPPGALVWLNDQEVGRTPVTVPFNFYGTYDVRLHREGHRPLWTEQEAKAPWWDLPGLDLIFEVIPNGKSHQDWHFKLQPAPPVKEEALIDRARQMRALTNQSSE